MPPPGGEESLYLRPFIFATEPGLGVRPATSTATGDRLAGRRLLPGRDQAGQRVVVDRVRAGRARGHRRGQVRWQLRGIAARAGPGRRERLRPGGLARRRRTPLRRGDGRHEPVLRVRQRRLGAAGHPGAQPARCCPASPGTRCCSWPPTRASRWRSAGSTSTNGRRRPQRGDHRGVRLRHRRGHHPGVAR